jgi:hypothetical protein
VVGIAASYGLDDRGVGVRVPVVPRIFSSPRRLGSTQLPIQWVTGTLSPGVKRPGREANHSPAASKTWSLTSKEKHRLRACEKRVLMRIFEPKKD